MPEPVVHRDIGDLCTILSAEKSLVLTGGWSLDSRTSKRRAPELRLTAAIQMDGIAVRGLSFAARCNSERMDECVSLNLLTEWGLKPRCFARIDWRGGIHQNSHKVCDDLQFTDAGRTHFHDTSLHRHVDIPTLFGSKWDLPIARPISPDPETFRQLLEISSTLMHIVNLKEIADPPWRPRSSFL